MTFALAAPPFPFRSGLERDLGEAGSVISGGAGEAAESSVSGIVFLDISTRDRAVVERAAAGPDDAAGAAPARGRPLAPDDALEPVDAAEGDEGEGVENRRRDEESTAKSGSVSLVRRRSSAKRLAIEEDEQDEAEEECSMEEEGRPEARSGGTAGSNTEFS